MHAQSVECLLHSRKSRSVGVAIWVTLRTAVSVSEPCDVSSASGAVRPRSCMHVMVTSRSVLSCFRNGIWTLIGNHTFARSCQSLAVSGPRECLLSEDFQLVAESRNASAHAQGASLVLHGRDAYHWVLLRRRRRFSCSRALSESASRHQPSEAVLTRALTPALPANRLPPRSSICTIEPAADWTILESMNLNQMVRRGCPSSCCWDPAG